MKTKEIVKSVWPYLWKYRRGMALGMGALLLTDIMKAALPLAIRSGIDSLMKGFRLSLVFEFAALIVLISRGPGDFPILDARDPHRPVARHRVRSAQRSVLAHRHALAGFLREIPHRRHHGARHQRSERRPHDARPWHHVFHRDVLHGRLSDRRHVAGGLAADAVLPDSRRRW